MDPFMSLPEFSRKQKQLRKIGSSSSYLQSPFAHWQPNSAFNSRHCRVISLWWGHKRWKTSISIVKDQNRRQHKTAVGSDSCLTLQRHSVLSSFVLFFSLPFDFLIHNKDILRFHQTRGFHAAPSPSHVHTVNSLSVTFIDIKIAKVTGWRSHSSWTVTMPSSSET